jgi:hypothetical protein
VGGSEGGGVLCGKWLRKTKSCPGIIACFVLLCEKRNNWEQPPSDTYLYTLIYLMR